MIFSLIPDPLYFLFFKLMFDWDATDYSNWFFYKDMTKAIGRSQEYFYAHVNKDKLICYQMNPYTETYVRRRTQRYIHTRTLIHMYTHMDAHSRHILTCAITYIHTYTSMQRNKRKRKRQRLKRKKIQYIKKY